MKRSEDIVKFSLIICGLLCVILGSCSYLNRQFCIDDDNAIEQAIEDAIEDEFGIDLDLTP